MFTACERRADGGNCVSPPESPGQREGHGGPDVGPADETEEPPRGPAGGLQDGLRRGLYEVPGHPEDSRFVRSFFLSFFLSVFLSFPPMHATGRLER